MLAILNSLNAHNFPIFPRILLILVSKFMIHRALSADIVYIRVAVPFLTYFTQNGHNSSFGHSGLNMVFKLTKFEMETL